MAETEPEYGKTPLFCQDFAGFGFVRPWSGMFWFGFINVCNIAFNLWVSLKRFWCGLAYSCIHFIVFSFNRLYTSLFIPIRSLVTPKPLDR